MKAFRGDIHAAGDAARCLMALKDKPTLQPWTKEREETVIFMAYELSKTLRQLTEAIIHPKGATDGNISLSDLSQDIRGQEAKI